jgi:hypothetical protein
MKEPCNGTCDAWGSVGHGQKIVLVHCERKPKCASKGTIISMKSEKIVNFPSMRDTMVFIEMSVCFITIIVGNMHGFQNMILSSVGAVKGDVGVSCMLCRQML